MITPSSASRAVRGTKRVCEACAVRFYDLSRTPINCPACGAIHEPAPVVVAEARVVGVPFAGKVGWRSKSPIRPVSVVPVAEADSEGEVPPEIEVAEDGDDEAAGVELADDIVLEEEPDTADVSELVDRDLDDDLKKQ